MSSTAALQRLQAADDHRAALRSQAAALEASIARDPELERLEGEAGAARAAADQADQAATETETRAGRLRERARVAERRLYDGSIGNPQELLALQHELEGVQVLAAEEEAALLSAMEGADEAGAEARAAAEAVTERRRLRAESAAPDAARLGELQRALGEAEAARGEAAAATDPVALNLYTRLATRLRPAVVRLSGDSCGGCRHGLGIGEVRAVRFGDATVQCPNCDRILVP